MDRWWALRTVGFLFMPPSTLFMLNPFIVFIAATGAPLTVSEVEAIYCDTERQAVDPMFTRYPCVSAVVSILLDIWGPRLQQHKKTGP